MVLPCHFVTRWLVSSYGSIPFHCLDVPHLVCPFSYREMPRLLPRFGISWLKLRWTPVCGFSWGCVFSSSGWISRSRSIGLYDESMFSFVRNHQTVFQSGRTSLHSHQQWLRVPVLYLHLGVSLFCTFVILIGVRWYLIIVLMCISLMTDDVELTCTWRSPLVRHPDFSAHCLRGLFVFYCWV